MEMSLVSATSAFLGALLGSYIGSRLAWRKNFVTREEALELGRAIDAQWRQLQSLHDMLVSETNKIC
jgi:hypothetical protein